MLTLLHVAIAAFALALSFAFPDKSEIIGWLSLLLFNASILLRYYFPSFFHAFSKGPSTGGWFLETSCSLASIFTIGYVLLLN